MHSPEQAVRLVLKGVGEASAPARLGTARQGGYDSGIWHEHHRRLSTDFSFWSLAAAVLGLSLERRQGSMGHAHSVGLGILHFLDNTLCTDGLAWRN